MAEDWRATLLPASYRGIPFETASTVYQFGRRGELVEYPLRDIPNFDDVGRKARRFKILGFVIGPDYRFDMKLLIEALEAQTPGILTHPTLGVMMVVCVDGQVSESTGSGLMAEFDMDFVESGLPIFPAIAESVLSAIETAVDALDAAAAFDFADVLEVIGKPGQVLLDAISDTTDTVDSVTEALFAPGALVANQVGDIATGLQRLADSTSALLQAPEDLAAQWAEIFGLVTDRAQAQAAAEALALSATVDTTATPTVQTIQANQIAVYALPRRLALSRACTLAAAEDLAVYDDAQAVRTALLGLIDVEIEVAPLRDDTVIQALQDLRVQTARAIDAAAGDAIRLRTVTPAEPLPACVLAQQLYGDGSRGDEIVARNNTGHPGFLAGPLRVLAS